MDFEELYRPYAGMATLEETLAWLAKRCAALGISAEARDVSVQEVFLELSSGTTFPVDGGGTGFDGVPHAAINHHMLRRAMEVNARALKAFGKSLNETLNVRIKVEGRPLRRLWARWTS